MPVQPAITSPTVWRVDDHLDQRHLALQRSKLSGQRRQFRAQRFAALGGWRFGAPHPNRHALARRLRRLLLELLAQLPDLLDERLLALPPRFDVRHGLPRGLACHLQIGQPIGVHGRRHLLALERANLELERRETPPAVFEGGGDGALSDGEARARRVEDAHRLVRQLPAAQVAIAIAGQPARRLRRECGPCGAPRASTPGGASSRPPRPPIGSSTLTTWNRRASAASFSKYFLYSDHVVAAMVRNSPRASAGFSRLAASLCPAWPPAPIIVWASSMNRMIGCGEAFTSAITDFSRFSNSPLMPAPACSSAEIERAHDDVAERRRHVAFGDPQREAFDHGGLADAGFAGQDGIVLPPSHQDVDDLADLEIAASDRVDLAFLRARRSDRW